MNTDRPAGNRPCPHILPLLCALLLAAPCPAAERVQLGFTPMGSGEAGKKTLGFDWDAAWFSRSSGEYNHGLARLCCLLSAAAYSLDADGRPADLLDCYRKLGADEGSLSYHYDLDYGGSLGNDQCAYSMATVPLPDGSPLVILTVRGTPPGDSEWLSNLNIADSKTGGAQEAGGMSYHEGFLRAERLVLDALLAYTGGRGLDRHGMKLLVTGHSRGAAVANIIGSHIVQQNLFDSGGCYVYTIASPNVTTIGEDLAKSPRFSFIWNIVNAEDVVPAIPFNNLGNWNYRKFGNVKVLANAWSAGRQSFRERVLPKVSETYRYLMGRDYIPAGAGPFIQVQLGKLLTNLNADVDSFYKGPLSMHKYLAKALPAMFPTEEEKAAKKAKGPALGDQLLSKIDEGNDGLITRIFDILNNLHQGEGYLSFLMGLDEQECFSDAPSVQLLIKGLPEAAVLDGGGKEITRLKEGQTRLFELHESSAACRLGTQTAALGFPTDEDFLVILTDTSVFPSPVSITAERYSADGVLLRSETETIYPCHARVYRIKAGAALLSGWGLDAQTLRGAERKAARGKSGIWQGQKKRLAFESDFDSDLNLGLGLSYGTQTLYGLALYRLPLQKDVFGTWEIDLGLGHKTKLWNSTYLDSELVARGVVVPDSDLRDESEEETGRSGVFSLVPALRLSLAWQPLRKAQLYAFAMGSLAIRDFNEAAFESHRVSVPPVRMGGSLGLVPSFGIGLRF